jgi:hypothetical protein
MEATGYDVPESHMALAGAYYVPFLLALVLWCRRTPTEPGRPGVLEAPGLVTALAGLAIGSATIVQFLSAGGLEMVMSWGAVTDRWTGYRLRYEMMDVEVPRRFSSALSAFVLIPTLSAILLTSRNGLMVWTRLLIVAGPLALSCVRAFANLQRGPAIIQCVISVCLVGLAFVRPTLSGRGFARIAGLLLVLSGAFFAVGVQVFDALDPENNPAWDLASRVVAIPAYTGALYFSLFPWVLDFRGFSGSFHMPLGSADEFLNDVTNVKMIGFIGNGYPHNANANFIATAFSGGGWIGVLTTSVLVFLIIVGFGRLAGRLGWRMAMAITISGLHGIYFLTQADFAASMTVGFVFNLLILAAFCLPGWLHPEIPAAPAPDLLQFRRPTDDEGTRRSGESACRGDVRNLSKGRPV